MRFFLARTFCQGDDLMHRRNLLRSMWTAGAATWLAGMPFAATAAAPSLMLANVYRANIPLADYWVSEKYDGVRGYWDGAQLWTRGGERINAPRLVHRRLAHCADGRRAVGGPGPVLHSRVHRAPANPCGCRVAKNAFYGV